jgi:chitin disaccharide deacetylase
MSRQLIVNADDFGRSWGVSRGILHAHRQGIVTSTTAMANLDAIGAHLAEALTCPGLGLGVHLVFCSWRPVLPPGEVPGLVDGRGFFLDQHTFWRRAEEIPLDQLRAELTAQVERFTALAGRPPDHLDCHQFVHAHPRFFELYLELAEERHLPLRNPFSCETDWETQVLLAPFLAGSPPEQWQHVMDADLDLLRRRGPTHPQRTLTTFFGARLATLDNLLSILDTVGEGVSELISHPGYADEALAASGYRGERETELALLTHPVVRERVLDLGLELVTFAAVRS